VPSSLFLPDTFRKLDRWRRSLAEWKLRWKKGINEYNRSERSSAQIIHSVRVANPGDAQTNETFGTGANNLTVRTFLSLRAVRATNSFNDIDISSNNNSTDYHLQNITVPLLVVSSGAHYFIPAGEKHYDAAKSQDKDFVVIEELPTQVHLVPPAKVFRDSMQIR
jgi:hypothetical protein